MVLKITVKTLDSQNYQFEANEDWNVRQFKEHIQPTVNASSDEQRLIFCGRVLQDDKKLTHYDCNGKVIHLVRRPPPSLVDLDRDSSTADNNNNGGENRFLDESNVLFSAMTLGPEANQVLRQLLTLRQASFARATGNEGLIEQSSMTETERHLHNATRLLRVTVNSIRECMARIAVLPMPVAERSDAPQPIIISASSQTDLQRSGESQAETISHDARSLSTASETTVDDINVRSSGEQSSGRPLTRSRVPRQSLTTDDLPQSGRPQPHIVLRPLEARASDGRQGTLSLRRRGGSLDRYLDILNFSGDMQDQLQGLVRRYRQLIDMSRRGGLIVPQASTSARSEAPTTSSSSQQNPQLSSALMNEARILGLHIPRIMHHMSHLQHALSNFSVDFTRGRLLLYLSSSDPRLSQRRFTRRSDLPANDAPRNPSTNHPPTNPTIPRPPPRLEGSVTITATTVEPNALRQGSQANATIIVTSEPSSGIHVPLSIPISYGPNHLHMDLTGTRVPPTAGATRQPADGQANIQAEGSAQQQPNSPSPNTTPVRPLGVLTGRVPVPYDYYLSCFSPWASLNRPGEASTARIQLRTARQQGAAPTQTSSAEAPTTNASQTNAGGPDSPFDMGLTEVVSNIVGTILRGPQAQGTSVGSNQSQDPLLNIIPELALNAASQILGGVLGLQTSNPPQQQQPTQQQQQQESRQRQMPPASSTVMMDIDIDDSSSLQSESGYQDACETRSPTVAANGANVQSTNPPSTSTSSSSSSAHRSIGSFRLEQPQASTSSDNRMKYNPQQLVEVMHNHPDWIPIIEADISLMERQSAGTNNQPVFSDAYLSSIPRKRRRLLTASPDRVLILQPSPSQAITNLLSRAITSSNSPDVEALDQVLGTISSDTDLQSAYEDYIKSAVEARLRSDYDYCPQKFENSSKYFK